MKQKLKLNKKIKKLKNLAISLNIDNKELKRINELLLRNDYGAKLSQESKMWTKKVKLVKMKSFKTVWNKSIKGPSDIIDTDELSVREKKAHLKYYYNKPIFKVPQSTMDFLKKNFDRFEEGFYEYIEFLMTKIEDRKSQSDEKYAIDRAIFLITTAKTEDYIDEDENIIAIHTNGNDRPTYKGVPEFLNKMDIKNMKEYHKTHPNIPIAAAQPGGMM